MPLHALYLHNYRFFHQQVYPKFSNGLGFVLQWDSYLTPVIKTVQLKFNTQRFLVCTFQETRSQVPVYFNGTPYNIFCY